MSSGTDSETPPKHGRSAASAGASESTSPLWWRVVRVLLLTIAVGGVLGSPWWGPRALSRLDFFHVRRVVFEGMRYTPRAEALALLKVDTLQSVWQELPPLAERLASHPLVASVTVDRQLPGTMVVRVQEREPVALVRRKTGRLEPVDGAGHGLPIDPAQVPMDVPLSASADSALMHLLEGLRNSEPGLFARVVSADRVKPANGPNEFRIKLDAFLVRTSPEVTVARFKDILPVEADLARNRLRAVELDLRFRNQVIARQP
ncbi:cell division protein FtsQ/DivIB [Gemmatimonas sp.]